jgi:hypothetical protein
MSDVTTKPNELRDLAEDMMAPAIGKVAPMVWQEMVADIESELSAREQKWRVALGVFEKSNAELSQAVSLRAVVADVLQCAQALLTALNVGDVQSNSPLHLKLREVMIAYREAIRKAEGK